MASRFNPARLCALAVVCCFQPSRAGGEDAAWPASIEATTTTAVLAPGQLVFSPYRIGLQALRGEIRYRISNSDPNGWSWPETSEQHVEMRGTTALLRVCDDCGSESAPSAETLSHMQSSNAWVRSDAERIIGIARAHSTGISVDSRMRALTIAVRRHMTGPVDYRDYADALTAYNSRRGDCTEFAVLLAAAARAVGIPTRVAYGIAYSSRFVGKSHLFSPHSWVQAWDGERWASYDAAFDEFDSGHIALFVGDGSLMGLGAVTKVISHLHIEDAEGVSREEP